MRLVHPHCGSLLPSTVSNAFALVNSTCVHVCGCTLISQRSLGVPHTSLPVPLPQDCQHLSVGAFVHLVRFRAASHHMWPLPCINIFCASHIYQTIRIIIMSMLTPGSRVISIAADLGCSVNANMITFTFNSLFTGFLFNLGRLLCLCFKTIYERLHATLS